MTAPFTMSIDNILRHSDSLETIVRASPDSYEMSDNGDAEQGSSSVEESGNGNQELESRPEQMSEEIPTSRDSTDAEQLAIRTLAIPTESLDSEFQRPIDPYSARQYDAIMAQPGPKRIKRRRIQELQNNNSSYESSRENTLENTAKAERRQKELKAEQALGQREQSKKLPNVSSNSSSLNRRNQFASSLEASEELVQPVGNVDLSLQSSRLTIRSPSINPPTNQRRFIAAPPQAPSDSSSRSSSVTEFRVPSPDSSSHRRRSRSSRSRSVHSNGAAPRRINLTSQSGANKSVNARTVNVKNFGG